MAKSINLGGAAAVAGTVAIADAVYKLGSADMAMAQRNTSRRDIWGECRRHEFTDKSCIA
ncbi:hypothetical protein [Mycobacterium kubicae]|uniref:hypothetical protein n=1 Tax=Mycobacterium kubicae TaxID=120959 RepID=UPI001F119EE2|nr:hypothetical protein [Mycobacterium kubicae]